MSVNRQQFLSDISKIKAATTVKEVVEQSDCISFVDGCVWGYNDEICISHPTDTDIEGSVSYKELIGVVSKLKCDEIDLDVTDSNLIISWGKKKDARFRIDKVKLPIDELNIPADDDWQELPSDFNEAVGFVLFCAGNNMAKPLLTCVHVKGAIAEASDNFRICQRTMKEECEEMLIPATAAEHIIKFNPDGYSVGSGWLYFINEEGTVICCRTYADKYPDLSKVIATDGDDIEFPAELSECLERAGVFSQRSITTEQSVNLTFGDKECTISAESECGKISETIPCGYKGKAITMRAHPQFLQKALKLLDKASITPRMLKMEGESFIHVVGLQIAK